MESALRIVKGGKGIRKGHVVEVAVYAPQGFRVKVDHERKPKRGEMLRLVQETLRTFFTLSLGEVERHEPAEIELLTDMIREECNKRLRRISSNPKFNVTPSLVIRALCTMNIDGVKFRIEGEVVMLPNSTSENLTPTIRYVKKK